MLSGGEQYVDYTLLDEEGRRAAGIRHARDANAGLPPIWMIHLPVGDLAEGLRRVREAGGTIIKATSGNVGEYVYAAVRDPVGARFALMQE